MMYHYKIFKISYWGKKLGLNKIGLKFTRGKI